MRGNELRETDAPDGNRGTAGSQRFRVVRRLVAATALALTITGGAAAAPASADFFVGGCYYNCAGDYRLSDPAALQTVDVRADLGLISLNLYRGHRGPVRVQAWVWSDARGWRVTYDNWVADEYAATQLGSPGNGYVSLQPGTNGAHSVYVRLSYSDGTTTFDGWVGQFRHFYWTPGGWTWSTYNRAYL